MAFQYLLNNLLVDVPGAQGAIFLDPEGESVEFVSRQATPYELKLEGAYHGIFLRQAARLANLMGAGGLERLSIGGTKMHVMSRALKDGYYVVLVMDPGSSVAVAGAALAKSSEAFNREIP
ncbi:MAG TPA: roadblock/LC7 domain-containing protein [Thermoanaerobaculaceae bacterium]|nr:roadblock/LC7 domain-containing protein [Thermoanaerobaculaceae bacterium]